MVNSGDQRAAVTGQVQRRVEHAVNRLLPGLHGLTLLLDEAPLSRTDAFDEFANVIHALNSRMSDLFSISTTDPNSHPYTTTPINTEGGPSIPPQSIPTLKRSRPHLLPPSPERRTKRRDSHAPF
jgi:hypothetical protein